MTKAIPPEKTPPQPRGKPLASQTPPEGPHARPGLIDKDKTPGSGMFPEPGTGKSEPPAG